MTAVPEPLAQRIESLREKLAQDSRVEAVVEEE
jgi:hypothetical protein